MATTDAPLGLRERKNRRTRLAIVRATSELTIEEGYHAATISRIAERADVAPRTVSTWFPAKDDILFEGGDAQIERGIEHLRTGEGDVVDRMLAWFSAAGEIAEPDPEITRLRNDAIQHDPELRARYRQYFERIQVEFAHAAARDTGSSPDDIGPQLLAGAAMAFLEQLAAITASGGHSDGLASEPITTGIEFLRAGLASISRTTA